MDGGEVEGEGILTKWTLFSLYVRHVYIFFVNDFVRCVHLVASMALRRVSVFDSQVYEEIAYRRLAIGI